ncbi:MAG TPA: tetratricopeptide repeat protein [Polyangiaceae bacterium]|nr:tetratricopeptide repeat protein [Polyangiaceae bacterium]
MDAMRSRLVIGVIVAWLTITTHAHSQGDKAEAERLFERGRTLMKEGRVREACTLLEQSFALVRGAGVQYNLARCLAELGRVASAHRHFVEVAELSRRAGQPDRARVAEERARALEPRLAWLRVEVSSPPVGLTVRDGETPIPRDERAIDPGEHRIRASAPGHRAWEQTLSVAESQHVVVRVPLLQRLDAPHPQPQPTQPPKPTEPRSADPLPLLVSGGILGGLGVIALGVSGGLAGLAAAKDDEADAYCDDTGCDPQGIELVDTAQTYGNAATIMLVSGALLAAGGLALLITGLVTDDESASLQRGIRF